ncbi:amidohydrolase family protein [Aurantibacter sp.]|uniref:amidohydrolase family protein n=1 Tax=Aurantibacter sp. TaxID=2807103 RepID=UPI00326324A3
MSHSKKGFSRREFITGTSLLALGTSLKLNAFTEISNLKKEPIIDIHQHIHYVQRRDNQLLEHQKAMGITTTILLPSGRPVNSASTHQGEANGLQAEAGGNAECYLFASQHKKQFRFGACAVPDMKDGVYEIEKYLKLGAVVIGELKFGVACDSNEMQKIYQLAQTYNVPVLMHWQYEKYNYGFERFYKMLEKYPKVNFIGHAQTWWANIDKNHTNQSILYPKTTVEVGGITDRYLSDYPNMYGDLSAGSGLNALKRDEEHAKIFLEKHQDKLLYGSDCADPTGADPESCSGTLAIAEIRKLVAKPIERKILFENSKKLFRL